MSYEILKEGYLDVEEILKPYDDTLALIEEAMFSINGRIHTRVTIDCCQRLEPGEYTDDFFEIAAKSLFEKHILPDIKELHEKDKLYAILEPGQLAIKLHNGDVLLKTWVDVYWSPTSEDMDKDLI